jgi:phosphatidylglycerophosphate synthase
MVTVGQVLMFVPNLIGYTRIAFMIASFFVAFSDPVTFLALYWSSFLLDALDGYAARYLNQSSKVRSEQTKKLCHLFFFFFFFFFFFLKIGLFSVALLLIGEIECALHDHTNTLALLPRVLCAVLTGLSFRLQFGAVLDMVTDRVATNALVIILSHLYPKHTPYFIVLCCLDLGSHWYRMYSSLLSGQTSHKETRQGEGFLLSLYYNNRIVLGTVCLMNEAFYVSLYITYHFPQVPHLLYITAAAAPFFVLKQYLSTVQLVNSCVLVAEQDVAAHATAASAKKK